MRTAVVTTSYPRDAGDAAGHFVRTDVRRRELRGEAVTVFAPGPPAASSGGVRFLPDGGCFGFPGALFRLRERPWRIVGAARFTRAARRALLAKGPFDRIVAHFIVPSAVPIAWDAKVPLEVVAHGSDVELLLRLGMARPVVAALLRRGAQFRFVSNALRDRLVAASTPALARASFVEPCPIDVSEAPARAAARARLGVGDVRLAVVCGRLIPSKRVDVALARALARADQVVVVGDGPERAALERAYPAARFVGHRRRSEALAWLAASDLVVTASRLEGAPTIVREARALGVPVLSAECGDVRLWAERDPGITLFPE